MIETVLFFFYIQECPQVYFDQSVDNISTTPMEHDPSSSVITDAQLLKDENDSSIRASHYIEDRVKEAIAKVGNESTYQRVLFVILILGFIMSCFFLNASGYLFMNPSFNCEGVDTKEVDACPMLDQCAITNDYTVTAYIGLYCGTRADQRNAIQSMLGLGSVFGVILINVLSDFRGRKFSFLFAIALQILAAGMIVAGAYLDSFLLLMASQFIAGFASSSLWTVYYVITDKLSSKKWAELAVVFANIGYGASLSSMIIFSNVLNWKYFVFSILVAWSILLFIFTALFLVQDPVLLFTKKKYEEYERSLRKIARVNRTMSNWPAVSEILRDLRENHISLNSDDAEQNKSWKQKLAYLQTFKERTVLKPALLFGILSLASFTTTFVIFFASNEVGLSYGVNITILGVAVILALFPMTFFSNRMPRKKGCFVCAVGQIVLSAVFIFKLPPALQTVLYGGIMFFSLGQYAIYIFWIVETFPQHIQSTSFGAVQTLGEVGKFISPLLVRAAGSLHISPVLVITAVDILLGFFFIFPLKQTLGIRNKTQNY